MLDVEKNDQFEIVENEEAVSLIIKKCTNDSSGNYFRL
jgi:hypothetical protein